MRSLLKPMCRIVGHRWVAERRAYFCFDHCTRCDSLLRRKCLQ